ncbi:hypothetical protein DNHGIG_02790 [Collibacillus ludicampi]|uniref:Uncharacterized protein n=1 Tax=Collibacillus ludicampi TaxID=2771369 RepID=A0AAV4LAG9_9BACL|nr:hypothetical protein DNHGIG_02790 [Collibacillus ludicampi]
MSLIDEPSRPLTFLPIDKSNVVLKHVHTLKISFEFLVRRNLSTACQMIHN